MNLKFLAWIYINHWVQSSFPTVPLLSTADLATQLSSTSGPPPVIIDTRTAEEYAVSHLPNAHHAETIEDIRTILEDYENTTDLSQQTPLVLYCSIGYRSGRLVQKLMEEDVLAQTEGNYAAVNLKGSIFQWANENRPLVTDGQSTEQVHPYNRTRRHLLYPSVEPSFDP